MRSVLLVPLLLLVDFSLAVASMPISSPWTAGDTWKGGYPGSYYNEQPYHITGGGLVSGYAIDFNRYPTSTSDAGYPIVAVADGVVTFAGVRNGFGNCVEIQHGATGSYNGKTVTSFYAHFLDDMPIVVSKQEVVKRGQVIGYCGMSGGTSSGTHLHFELREDGVSVQITSMDEYDWCDNSNCDGHVLTSQNSNVLKIADTLLLMNDRNQYALSEKPKDWLGGTPGDIGWYHQYNDGDLYESSTNTAKNCYRMIRGGGTAGAIVYDALGGARRAYCVGDQYWATWDNLATSCSGNCPTPTCGDGGNGVGGPNSVLGMPITNRYQYTVNPDHWRQDFQKGYIEDGTVVKCNTTTTPGWTSSGWNSQYSYIFADAYDRNGARRDVGNPISGTNGQVHVLSGNILIQDFSGGNDGSGMIMYDQQNWACNLSATNEAYWVYGDIKSYYDTNGGVSTFGCATIDRFQDAYGYWCQDFKNSAGTRYRIFENREHLTLGTCSGGTYNAAGGGPSQISGTNFVAFTGKFNADNYSDVGLFEPSTGNWYISVRDTASSQFIFDDIPWLTDWGNGTSGQYDLLVADFSGDGYDDLCLHEVATGRWYLAYSIQDGQYFERVNGLDTNGSWLDDWGKSSVGTYTPIVGKFNDDNLYDIGLYEAVSGNWYVAFRDTSDYRFNTQGTWLTAFGDGVGSYQPIVGVFSPGSLSDIGLYCLSSGNWYTALNYQTYFQRSGTNPWITGFGEGAGTYQQKAGFYNGDSYSDICIFRPSTGYWYVGMNIGDAFQRSATNPWITDWGTGSSGDYVPLTGYFNNDGYTDAVLYQPSTGNWFVSFNVGDAFTRQNGPGAYNSWLENWGIVSGTPKITTPGTDNTLPTRFSLSQNYPNPFNPVTVISYTLPAAAHVRLDVYNILGQKVVTLVNDKQEAGEHEIAFDCSACASGIYFYRLTADQAMETKKMLLLK